MSHIKYIINHSTSSSQLDDGTREVRIFGCEYRVPKQSLIDFLGHYGELLTKIVEELFEDRTVDEPETEETNKTGTYVAKIRLHRDIPELIPVAGRRVRVNYWGVQVLCTLNGVLNRQTMYSGDLNTGKFTGLAYI